MSAEETSFFVLGATGYIGGAAIVEIKKKFPSATYVAYTRSPKNAPALEALGFRVLLAGANPEDDHAVIQKAVEFADVVIDAADADDLPLAKVIIEGLKHSKKKYPIWIHTSGTGVVSDKKTGSYQPTADKIWDDNVVDDIKAIGESQPHRDVDLAIFEASKHGHSINYIIAPSTIYGVAPSNPVHKISQQVPNLIETAVKKRQTVYAGEGTNLWNNVHIADLADLYYLILEKALAERVTGPLLAEGADSDLDPYTHFYWGSVGTHSWGDVARALAPLLYKAGVVENDQAKSAPVAELPAATTTNSRTVSNRGFKDGWKPSRPSLEDTLQEDVDAVLAGLN